MDIHYLVENYKTIILRKYALFEGRAGRREFWSFVLANVVVSLVISLFRLQALSTLYSLAVLVPSLAVGVRRMHDINKSGWVLLLGLIPVVGQIILIVLAAQKGHSGSNKYGAGPMHGSHHDAASPAEPQEPAEGGTSQNPPQQNEPTPMNP